MAKKDILNDIQRSRNLAKKKVIKANNKIKAEKKKIAELGEQFTELKDASNDFLTILFNCETDEERNRITAWMNEYKRVEKEDIIEEKQANIENFSATALETKTQFLEQDFSKIVENGD